MLVSLVTVTTYSSTVTSEFFAASVAGLGFRHFGRFEGLAKSDQQKCTEMYRKHADFGYEIQVGYEHFGGK